MAELLTKFDGTTDDFNTWQNQLRLLKQIYRLDAEHIRIIDLWLRALKWLHSKTEHMKYDLWTIYPVV
jgi:hypothetical protein